MLCWSFLLDVILCGMAIVAYVIFNKKSIKHQRNNDVEESNTPDEPSSNVFIRQQQRLNLDTQALLERIGNKTVCYTQLFSFILSRQLFFLQLYFVCCQRY